MSVVFLMYQFFSKVNTVNINPNTVATFFINKSYMYVLYYASTTTPMTLPRAAPELKPLYLKQTLIHLISFSTF